MLLVCENNSVGVTTGRAQNEWSSSSMAAETLGDVPRALGIATEVVPGESVTAVYDAASRLIGDLREGRAPAFIEMRTRRWPGSRSFNPQLVTGVTDLTGDLGTWLGDGRAFRLDQSIRSAHRLWKRVDAPGSGRPR